ncbi:MAG: DNA polymerase I [Isosphaera sp.]|nr:DNA polymerase I [Isosphaera sp.]
MDWLGHFDAVWCVDFEFTAPPGERPSPVCLVGHEVLTGRRVRVWQDELRALREPPFPVGPRTLVVAYYASAELGCFLALGWPMPARVLDLFPEFKCRTSGLATPGGAGLLGALMYFGLEALDAAEKDGMRQLVMRGGQWTPDERRAVLDYCESDVAALTRLLPAMGPGLDLPRALIRGRYMAAAARMEWAGVPIDTDALAAFKHHWLSIKEELIARIDREFGVYDGTTFKADRWAAYLAAHNIPWPTLPSGKLALDDDTFREMSRNHPRVAPIRELRTSISQLRLNELAVGSDGRNRCLLSAFGSKTGRNQPSNSKFVFGPSAWLRSLIRPGPGKAVAYIDYSQQELAIAAALSGDRRMQAAYESGDFYLTFAKMAGGVPAGATKESHAAEREQFKTVALGVLYGLSADGLARKLNAPPCRGRDLLRMHKETFRQFWRWSDAVQDQAVLVGKLETVFGWAVRAGADANARSLRNFPMQANGSEMLRLACCDATEAGVTVCCPVHDAVLIEAAEAEIDAAVEATQGHMRRASEIVLAGFPLRTDVKVVRHPDRYSDKRGAAMWRAVCELCGRAP